MVDVRDTKTMRRSFRTRRMLPGGFPGLHPGLVCDAPSGHGVRNRVRAWDWERVDVCGRTKSKQTKKPSEKRSAPRPGSATPAILPVWIVFKTRARRSGYFHEPQRGPRAAGKATAWRSSSSLWAVSASLGFAPRCLFNRVGMTGLRP